MSDRVKVAQSWIDNHKKEARSLTKTIEEKDKDAVKIQNICENLEANVKRLKAEAMVLRK